MPAPPTRASRVPRDDRERPAERLGRARRRNDDRQPASTRQA